MSLVREAVPTQFFLATTPESTSSGGEAWGERAVPIGDRRLPPRLAVCETARRRPLHAPAADLMRSPGIVWEAAPLAAVRCRRGIGYVTPNRLQPVNVAVHVPQGISRRRSSGIKRL